VIGSQSILGAFADLNRFPEPLLKSVEVDILPSLAPDEESVELVDAFLGELSQFHQTHGVYADGVDLTTAKLPEGWQERLVAYRSEGTDGITALCLEQHDLAVSKLVAGRDSDYDFCRALLGSGIADPSVVRERLAATPDLDPPVRERVRAWIEGQQEATVSQEQQEALEHHRRHANDRSPEAPSAGEVPVREARTKEGSARKAHRRRRPRT